MNFPSKYEANLSFWETEKLKYKYFQFFVDSKNQKTAAEIDFFKKIQMALIYSSHCFTGLVYLSLTLTDNCFSFCCFSHYCKTEFQLITHLGSYC